MAAAFSTLKPSKTSLLRSSVFRLSSVELFALSGSIPATFSGTSLSSCAVPHSFDVLCPFSCLEIGGESQVSMAIATWGSHFIQPVRDFPFPLQFLLDLRLFFVLLLFYLQLITSK